MSSALDSQRDSQFKDPPKNTEILSEKAPSALKKQKSQKVIRLNQLETVEGLTGIGSPAYLNIKYGGVPEPETCAVSPTIYFEQIVSHKDRLSDARLAIEYCTQHALAIRMKSTSWNNIPQAVRDMF